MLLVVRTLADWLFKRLKPPAPIFTWAWLELTVPAVPDEAVALLVMTVPTGTPAFTLVKNQTSPDCPAWLAARVQVMVFPLKTPPGLMEPEPEARAVPAGMVSVTVTLPVLT